MSAWISVTDKLPPCSRAPDSHGTEVLIWPRTDETGATAYFGRRITSKPWFYKYGATLDSVTHWQALPSGPAAEDKLERAVG